MQELRLVGVQDDSTHLLFADSEGKMYRVVLDEALRTASSKKAPAAAQIESEPVHNLSPREVQARIRSGATAEEIVDSTGLELAYVQRYQGPVLAERAYIASSAQSALVSDAIPSNDGYRSAFGDDPARLGEMVSYRLKAMNLDPQTLEWDAWRRPDGNWTVTAQFDSDSDPAKTIGESAPAQWMYNASAKSVTNLNRWAQVLSEVEPVDSPLPARRLSAVADAPFDVDSVQPQGEVEPDQAHSEALLDMLRERRGRRLGTDTEQDDALATLLTENIPAAHPRDDDEASEEQSPRARRHGLSALFSGFGTKTSDDDTEQADDDANSASDASDDSSLAFWNEGRNDNSSSDEHSESQGEEVPGHGEQSEPDQPMLDLTEVFADESREVVISADPEHWGSNSGDAEHASSESERAASDGAADTEAHDATAAKEGASAEKKATIKPKRSSVPSWDEIVFGTKTD